MKEKTKNKNNYVKATVSNVFGLFKSFFISKFDLIVMIIYNDKSVRIFLTKVKDITLNIDGGEYYIKESKIRKTNLKHGMIVFMYGNPEPIELSHDISDSSVTSSQLKSFMGSEFVSMILKGLKNKNTSLTMMHWLMIIGFTILAIIIALYFTGVIKLY